MLSEPINCSLVSVAGIFNLLSAQKNRVNSQRQIWSLFWVFCDKKNGIIRTFYHFLRLYNLPQIRTLMQKAGLQVTATFGNYNGANYNRDSKRLILKASNLLFRKGQNA